MVVSIRNPAFRDSLSRAGHCHTGQLALQLHHRTDLSQYAVCHEGKTALLLCFSSSYLQEAGFADGLTAYLTDKPMQSRSRSDVKPFVIDALHVRTSVFLSLSYKWSIASLLA